MKVKSPSTILGQIIYIIEGGSSPSRYKRKFCISIALMENFLEESTLVPFPQKVRINIFGEKNF